MEVEKEADNIMIKWDIIGISKVRRDEELLELASCNSLCYRGTITGRTSGLDFFPIKDRKKE